MVCPRGKEHLADFALEVGEFALRFFTDWFGIVYPGDKLDLVAIPDFAFGAMENLGCVTFRERYLLVDPATATQAELQAVVDVIAHEIAHMWFGDLVTMKWWNGIWLNEAFATFMEMTCTDAFRPEWRRWVDFGLSRSAALRHRRPRRHPADRVPGGLAGRRRRHVRRAHLREGRGGRADARAVPGRRPLPAGIRRYMARHQYGNTETSDLWDALEAETGEPVRRIAESWIFQGGFPEVPVERGDGAKLRFSQRRFRYAPADDGARWAIPLVVGHRDGDAERSSTGLLDGDEVSFGIGHGPAGRAAAVGQRQPGRPRLLPGRYAPDLLDGLLAGLGDLTALERYALVDDAGLGAGGHRRGAPFVATAERFVDERDLSVWERIAAGCPSSTAWSTATPATPCTDGWRRWSGRCGPSSAPTPRPARTTAPARCAACCSRPRPCWATTGRASGRPSLLDRFLAHPPSVDPSLASPPWRCAPRSATWPCTSGWPSAFRAAANPQDRQRLQLSLTRFRDPDALQRTLELTLSGDVRTQDAPYLLGETLTNRDNAATAWAFVASHWGEIEQRFPANSLSPPGGRHPPSGRRSARRSRRSSPSTRSPGRHAGAAAHRAHGRDRRPRRARVRPAALTRPLDPRPDRVPAGEPRVQGKWAVRAWVVERRPSLGRFAPARVTPPSQAQGRWRGLRPHKPRWIIRRSRSRAWAPWPATRYRT